ncbi:MAG TPA: response regulator [Candidatus Polarisedimenticolia bacterium]|nr:response regulator [Candidatus Polarisedimenticolia bacterium]
MRVLFVEDSLADAFLLERALTRGGFRVVSERVDTAEVMRRALEQREWDLVLADHSMPQFNSTEALRILKEKKLDLPFIIVSGHIDEKTAIAAMGSGAHDYIMKDELARLMPAVERELREAEVRRARTKSEEELRRAHEELEVRVEKRTADLKEANRKLQDVLDERKRLEAELLEIAENERRRIGFDLHDDLGQKMTGMLLIARALEQRLTREQHKDAEEAQKICELIEQCVNHTHNLAHHFSSIDANGGDLEEVMSGLAATVEKMFGIPCECTMKGEIPPLPEDACAQFYKIAQEAVSNAIKHGKATCVWISIVASAQKLVMTVRNDGIPFSPPANPKARMGLRTMNYRANTIGATFDIRPNQKDGTIVTCVLPFKNGVKAHQNGSNGNGDVSAANGAKSLHAEAVEVQ